MKSPSLDAFYAQFDRHILLAQSYSEIEELGFIIKACRFKPHDYFENKINKLILHSWWFDEYGNSIKISKKLKVIYNDLSLNRSKIICTDLYYGLPIQKVIKISKLAYVFTGKDEDLLEDCFVISFLGIDNYLRTYSYLYGEWKQVASISLGIKPLKTIWKHIGTKNFLELKIKENMPFPCLSAQAWITYLPASSDFSRILEKQHNVVSSIFNTKD